MIGYIGSVDPDGERFWGGYSSFFIAGVFAGLFFKSSDMPTTNRLSVFDFGFLMCLIALPLFVPRVYGMFFPLDEGWVRNDAYIAYVTCFVFFSAKSVIAQRVFGNLVASWLGTISYSVYLLHVPILRGIRIYTDIDNNVYVYLVIFVCLTIALSSLLYLIFERPCMNWLNKRLTFSLPKVN